MRMVGGQTRAKMCPETRLLAVYAYQKIVLGFATYILLAPPHLTFFLPPPSTCYASLLTLQPTTLATTPVAWAATHPTACRRLRGARAYDTGLSVYSGIGERGCNKLTFPRFRSD